MNPVTYQGTTYPSQSAAARALGVHHNTILRHLNVHGSLDRLHNDPSGGVVPVSIAGRSWISHADLARALGVDKATITRWLAPTASKRQKARLHHRIAMLGHAE